MSANVNLIDGRKAALPDGILAADLKALDWKDAADRAPEGMPWEDREFELWYTERFGWCIPTLDIAGARRGMPRRTYGVIIGDRLKVREAARGGLVTMGAGPHVLATLRVYVRTANAERMAPYITLRREGQAKAGETRDRISTRRMNTIARRRGFGGLGGIGGAW